MQLLTAVLFALLFSGACATVYDALRSKLEDLSETLYLRGSYRDPWLNIIPRANYPKGAGYVRSSFTVGRSEPSLDEESWSAIAPISGGNPYGAVLQSYTSATVGHKEDTYKPDSFGLVGPLVSQDDLTMYWNSTEFWAKYFQALEKRNRRSIINRVANVYMQYVPKFPCLASGALVAGDYATQPAPQNVDLSMVTGANTPTSELTQEYCDAVSTYLIEEGAADANTNGWITLGPDGPQFPLLIGVDMSHRLLLNNAELRSDFNQSFQGWGDANPVIKRLGASRVIKNFRHVVTPYPPRWALVTNGTTTVIAKDSTGATTTDVVCAIAGAVATLTYRDGAAATIQTVVAKAANGQIYIRIPTWTPSTATADATKGSVAITNPVWRDASVAKYEGATVLNPYVYTEEILMPVNSAPGMKLKPANYFGEWNFITGNDALLGFPGCTGIVDPTHRTGRHFAEYRHGCHPIFPLYGTLFLYTRCSASYDESRCS